MLAGSYLDRTVRYLLDVLLIGQKIHLSYFFYFFSRSFSEVWQGQEGKQVSQLSEISTWQSVLKIAMVTCDLYYVFPCGASQVNKGFLAICPWLGILQSSPAYTAAPSQLSIRACRKPGSTAWRVDLETYLCVCVIWRRSPGQRGQKVQVQIPCCSSPPTAMPTAADPYGSSVPHLFQ